MANSIESRPRYRSSMRVAWQIFLPGAVVTLLLTLFLAFAMSWLFDKGWYIIILVPAACAGLVALFVSFTIQMGKCRFPALAGAFGLFMGLLLYTGYFYFGMLLFLGSDVATQFNLLPKYISLRLNTDVQHDVGRPDEKSDSPSPGMTGFTYLFELTTILFITTLPAYLRAKRGFCEKCNQWKLHDTAKFPPKSGATIRQWLEQGELSNLATLPKFTPPSPKNPFTLAAIEWCGRTDSEKCSSYFNVKDVSKPLGLTMQYDNFLGKVTIPRVELTEPEKSALTPIFPKLAGPLTPSSPPPLSNAQRSSLIEIKPIPPSEAHKVLNKTSIAIANGASLLILVAFFGSLLCSLGALQLSQLTQYADHHTVKPVWIALAILCLPIAVFSGYIGLKNPGIVGDLWYRRRALKSIALRRNKLFDPQRETDLPTFFVGVTPRKNWGRVRMEMSEDIGFLQIDPRKAELRFEGDVEQYRIPASAITSCTLESYTASAGNTRIEYFAVVVQGTSPQGLWEAPFYPRKTKWFLPSDHRRQAAEEILTQITNSLPLATNDAPVSMLRS